jgi:peptidyl-prolyl cis-trans isomerase C
MMIRRLVWLPWCALLFGATLAGCSDDKAAPARPGQALASVNGEEITVLQLNEEVQRAGVPAAQQQQASKQLLQALIDRTLLQEEAAREKLDRDPKVMQAIERARALIIAQAYMQKRVGDTGRPSDAEVQDYFDKNPQFFANRKQFTMNQLILPAAAATAELRAAVDKARSLEEVAVMLDARKIGYGRAQVTRSTADLNPQLSARLLSMPKDQIIFAREGPRAMLVAVAEVVDAPVTLAIAAPQIAQFLATRKNRELAQAEIGRLRSAARIEYMNKALAPDPAGGAALAQTAGHGTVDGVAAGAGGGVAPAFAAGTGAGGMAANGGVNSGASNANRSATAGASGVSGAASRVAPGAGPGASAGNTAKDGADNVDKAALERGVGGLR